MPANTDIDANNNATGLPKHPTTHLKPYQWKKGQSGNPKGRPPTKTLKEFVRETLARMSDEERDEFLLGMPKLEIWKMAEGQATEDKNIRLTVPKPILGGLTQPGTITQLPHTDTPVLIEKEDEHIAPGTHAMDDTHQPSPTVDVAPTPPPHAQV